uniref:ribonuclease III n=1 Tax=Lepeophtheirus salmonis TaxID=72036 RepID=A0A0K2UZN8_LEPSM
MSTGGGCWVAEAVPSASFTPQEHSVELLRVIFSQNTTPVLVNPSEKPFLVLSLIRDYAGPSIRHANARAVLSLPTETQIQPWREFLERSTNFKSGITVLTHEELLEYEDIENIALLILDAAHVLNRHNSFFKEMYPKIKARINSRIITLTAFLFNGDKTLGSLDKRLSKLENTFGNRIETSCEVLTTLRYVSKPRFGVLTFIQSKEPNEVESQIENSIQGFINFLKNHRFSLEETYGEDFEDIIQEIPDPSKLPLKLIDDFLNILRTCGVWCAERAALLLTIKIDKLKTREKYERHYLLLSVLYTEMLKICKICDDAFADLTDREKMTKYSKPKLLRLMSVLLQYKPEHITDHSEDPKEKESKDESSTKEEEKKVNAPPVNTQSHNPHHRYRSKRKIYYSYDDPNALCGVVFVQDKFIAKILYHYLKEYSKSDNKFSFLTPQYAITLKPEEEAEETDEGLLNHRKQEEGLRRFRMRECNILISNSLLEVGIDGVRCNLVLAFDAPDSFHTYAHYKVKAKSSVSWFLSLCQEDKLESYLNSLKEYHSIEKSLVDRCQYKDPSVEERYLSDANDHIITPFIPKNLYYPTCYLKNSILLLNRYCAKLPSDTFTRLTPLAGILKTEGGGYICGIQLPINCPLKKIIIGLVMPNETLAKRAAAYAAILELHKIGELDPFMNPVGKDGTGHAAYLNNRFLKHRNYHGNRTYKKGSSSNSDNNSKEALTEKVLNNNNSKEESSGETFIKIESESKDGHLHGEEIDTQTPSNIEESSSETFIKGEIESKDDLSLGDGVDAQSPSNMEELPIIIMEDMIVQSQEIKEEEQFEKVENESESKDVHSHRDEIDAESDSNIDELSILMENVSIQSQDSNAMEEEKVEKVSQSNEDGIKAPKEEVCKISESKDALLSTESKDLEGVLGEESIEVSSEACVAANDKFESKDIMENASDEKKDVDAEQNNNPVTESNTTVNDKSESKDVADNAQSVDNTKTLPSGPHFDPPRPGTTKRRQYYYKKVAGCLKPKNNDPSPISFRLYHLNMELSCPIPDDQNTRGRKIYPPENSVQGFGFLVRGGNSIPPICPFPIYTRSGEVLVEIKEKKDSILLTEEEYELIICFHRYTFSKVLRLEKYPMQFTPDKSRNSILILPMVKSTEQESELGFIIDWDFLRRIKEENEKKMSVVSDEDRTDYTFDKEDYLDAVIMPWYRNQDQPQYFYVAEICEHLNPTSDFPGQGFETFSKYYQTKYNITIQNLEQPLLDVDHTSHRLNFLTPRYVNRKGVALPTSSEETKRNKRENLEQKQILVPELCQIHPFPASLWRQTVSLPCILYRINGLLIADDLRSLIAREMSFGKPELDSDFVWPPLNFGWTLADVLKNRDNALALNTQDNPKKNRRIVNSTTHVIITEALSPVSDTPAIEEIFDDEEDEGGSSKGDGDDLTRLSDRIMNKMNEEDNKRKQRQLEIGTWSNDLIENVGKQSKSIRSSSIGGKFLRFQDEFDEEDLELLDPNMALPDNLTLLSNELLPKTLETEGGSKDWGTGIEQKIFRVGSPTFFSNPNINIPGMMDDLDGLSCSDSDDDEDFYENFDSYRRKALDFNNPNSSVTQDGSVRIEFRGENMAEAIEDEHEENLRVESLARNLEEEAKMLSEVPWPEEQNEEAEDEEKDIEDQKSENEMDSIELEVIVLKEKDTFNRYGFPEKQSCVEYQKLEYDPEKNAVMDEKEVVETFMKDFNINNMDIMVPIDYPKDECEFTGVLPRDSDEEMSFSFDHQPELVSHPGPSPSIILQGLTMSNSNDAINLERLETIGDSFLKYAITSYLFNVYDTVHEGRLSHLRSKQVSNLNLFKLGRKKKLGECMIATKFEPHDNWLPPSYHVQPELEQALIESGVPANLWNMAELPSTDFGRMTTKEIVELIQEKSRTAQQPGKSSTESVQDMPSFVPYNLLTQHSIPDKSIADCVEALIGAYLISCGQRGALLFMTWLGLKVIPPEKNEGRSISSSQKVEHLPHIERQLNFFLSGYEEFEELIGYKFKDKTYLLQSFSHASFYPNRITDCYQRLEFLGDAILDYLITRHLYEDPRQHSPGALTDLRSALVNNTIFAFLAVKFQFHKYFKHFSPGLQTVIDRFVKLQVQNEFKVFDEFYLIEEDDDSEEAEDIEVPKALGDIFESVAGAIFLDSGLSLDAVWCIYFRMMQTEIEQFSSNVPKSPIRELLELEPETAKFGKPEKLADGKRVRVSVEVFGKGTFKGIGRNYRIAKCTAAKCALRALKKSSHSHHK